MFPSIGHVDGFARPSNCRSRPLLSLGTTLLLDELADGDAIKYGAPPVYQGPRCPGGENGSREQVIVQSELRVKTEQEATQSWVVCVCKACFHPLYV